MQAALGNAFAHRVRALRATELPCGRFGVPLPSPHVPLYLEKDDHRARTVCPHRPHRVHGIPLACRLWRSEGGWNTTHARGREGGGGKERARTLTILITVPAPTSTAQAEHQERALRKSVRLHKPGSTHVPSVARPLLDTCNWDWVLIQFAPHHGITVHSRRGMFLNVQLVLGGWVGPTLIQRRGAGLSGEETKGTAGH